jgi:hypothetical protein
MEYQYLTYARSLNAPILNKLSLVNATKQMSIHCAGNGKQKQHILKLFCGFS